MKKSSNKNSRDNNFLTAKRIEEIMSELGYKKNIDQKNFAHDIDVLPQNFSRFMNSGKESTYYCKKIVKAFPQYNLAWLLGYSDIKTVEELESQCASRSLAVSNASITLLEESLQEVCFRENMDVPTLDNIPELLLLQAQLRDYADSLMWNYVKHRERSHVWNFLDHIPTSKK